MGANHVDYYRLAKIIEELEDRQEAARLLGLYIGRPKPDWLLALEEGAYSSWVSRFQAKLSGGAAK